MVNISDKAGEEIKKVLDHDDYKGKKLVLYFQGAG
jgi:hypothetical protein